MLARLRNSLSPDLHQGQFGGMPGRSMTHAIREIADMALNSTSRYVVGIFFDIRKAFDRMWWPAVMDSLSSRSADTDICALVGSYLSNRHVILPEYGQDCERTFEMGIPQGSVLGPCLWPLLFNGALRELENVGLRAVAYVDDLAVVVRANTKAEIEEQGRRAVNALTTWCRRVKLSLAPEKTEMMLLKGSLNMRSPPVIRIEGKTIKAPAVVTYLGVRMSTGLRFGANARYVRDKIPARVAAIRAMCGATWGLSYRSRQIYYSALCQSVLLYAAPAWMRGLRAADWATLLSAQRTALLTITQAYRTTSTDALQVIAGRPPLDLRQEQ